MKDAEKTTLPPRMKSRSRHISVAYSYLARAATTNKI